MKFSRKGIPITGMSSKFYDRYNRWGGFGEPFRRQVLDEAHLKAGESVLDCGCGTGTLAVAAKRLVGAEGEVIGIDLSADQLAIATKKARKENLDIKFHQGSIDELPFPDESFDAIFSTLMIHHVPSNVKVAAFQEMRRVIKLDGRIIVADFGPPKHWWGWIVASPILLPFLVVPTCHDNLFNRLPAMMSAEGLEVTDHRVLREVVHLLRVA